MSTHECNTSQITYPLVLRPYIPLSRLQLDLFQELRHDSTSCNDSPFVLYCLCLWSIDIVVKMKEALLARLSTTAKTWKI